MNLPDGHSKRLPRSPRDVDHLSFSSVSTFMRCPRQWAYAYLEQLRRPPGVALLRGGAVDKAASTNLAQKIESRTDMPKNDVCELAEDAFRTSVDVEGGPSSINWDTMNQARALDSTIGLTAVHMQLHAPNIQPVAVQLELHRDLTPNNDGLVRDFVGHLDYVTEDRVGDIKTGNRRMGQPAADNDLQPSAYAYLLGHPIAFEFARVIDTGTRKYEEVVETGRDERAINWYAGAVAEVGKAIDASAFPPNTSTWACSPKFCGFWQRCQVENKPPEFPS